MFLFSAADAGSMQERIVLPSTSTVHAPHCPRPQPNRGPCRDRLSRKTYRSGVFGSASTVLDLPFTFSEIRAMVNFLSQRIRSWIRSSHFPSLRIPPSPDCLFPIQYTPSHLGMEMPQTLE